MSEPLRLVLIDWIDSTAGVGWQSVAEHLRQIDEIGLACRSVGWLIREDATSVVVSSTLNAHASQANQVMAIPKVAVLSIVDVAE